MHCKAVLVFLGLATFTFAQTTPPDSAAAAAKRPFTFADMMALKRVAEPVPSPDGKWVVFAMQEVDVEENTKPSHLWIVPASGGEARRLNDSPNEEERPRFSPDGKELIFTSKATEPAQVWMCEFDSAAGALKGPAHQVTALSTGADGAIWSPDGKNIVFLSSVYPDCKDDACNDQRDAELKKSKVKAKIFTRLLYRHWTAYTDYKRSHLFVISALSRAGEAETMPARDLTPGDHDVPPFHLGGDDLYAISPDGKEVAYTSNVDEVEATSTNNEIFLLPITGGEPKKISSSPGNDNTPRYSPDGNQLAWRSMARAGFEADKQSLIICERKGGQWRNVTSTWDRSVGSFVWAPNSKTMYLTAEDHGEAPIYSFPLDAKQPN